MMKSQRLHLINCGPEILRAAIAGHEELAKVLGVEVPEHWTEFGAAAFRYSLARLADNPASQPWWTYLIIHHDHQRLVGTCGYKGPPDQGVVEIGYEIVTDYRGQGLASEAAGLLVNRALQEPTVERVWAHTLEGPNASTRVLEKMNFRKLETLETEEGRVWKWEYLP